MDDWSAQLIRLSLFSDAPIQVSEGFWTSLTGQAEAENRAAVPGGRQYSSQLHGGSLSLTIAVNRLFVVLAFNPISLPEDGSERLPVLGGWKEFSESFQKLLEDFLPKVEFPIVRIGVGANLVAKCASRRDAYVALGTLLKSVTVDADHMSDLVFRVNWPQSSNVAKDLMLNRITNWSSVTISHLMMAAQAAHPAPLQVGSIFAVSLEMDHNTAADRQNPLEKSEILPISQELFSLARENAARGERP
jgi:hypothetical protein